MNNWILAPEAEWAVLGGMLMDCDCICKILTCVHEDDFVSEKNREIFGAIRALYESGMAIDGVTVSAKLGDDAEIRKLISKILECTPTAANAMEYAKIVALHAERRRFIEVLSRELDNLASDCDVGDAIARIEDAIRRRNNRVGRDVLSSLEQFSNFWDYREKIENGSIPYIPTGIRPLDELLGGGFVSEGLYFLAARPGVGKTALALDIANHITQRKEKVLFFSLEMSANQLFIRRLSALTMLDNNILQFQKMNEEQNAIVARESRTLATLPFLVQDRGAMSVSEIVSIASGTKDLKLVIIDHFTLIKKPGKQQSFVEYADISHTLKQLAKLIQAPVLCLIQLNRESEQRKGRAHLSDLRGSGATEEDADGVMILHRPADAEDDDAQVPVDRILMDLYLDKNRHGATGKINLSFRPKFNIFNEAIIESRK